MRVIIIHNTTIQVPLTADDWDLYTSSMDCTPAALDLNQTFENAVNAGLDLEEVERRVYSIQRKWSKFGASDTEPNAVVQQIIRFLKEKGFPKQKSAHFIKE